MPMLEALEQKCGPHRPNPFKCMKRPIDQRAQAPKPTGIKEDAAQAAGHRQGIPACAQG